MRDRFKSKRAAAARAAAALFRKEDRKKPLAGNAADCPLHEHRTGRGESPSVATFSAELFTGRHRINDLGRTDAGTTSRRDPMSVSDGERRKSDRQSRLGSLRLDSAHPGDLADAKGAAR